MSGNPNNYLQQNSQMGVFGNSNLMAFSGGLNTPGGAGLGGVGAGGDTGLASHAARMGFAHAGNLQQQQQQQQHPGQQQQGHGMGGEVHPKAKGRIREVWRHNLHEEMATLRELVENYPYIAMVRSMYGLLVAKPSSANASFV
jgi:CCR4-NOT transcription complex subunit 7/8